MTVIRKITKYFLTGILALLPFVVTIGIVIWLSNFLFNYIGPGTQVGTGLKFLGYRLIPKESTAYIYGWVIVLSVIFLLGFCLELFARKLISRFDDVFKKIPIIGSIYGTTRKLTDMMNSQSDSSGNNMKNMLPVYCRFGSEKGGTLFLALLPSCDEYAIQGIKYKVVVVPTAPIPFGGAMILVPSENVFSADISVEKLMNFYISMGITGDLTHSSDPDVSDSNSVFPNSGQEPIR